MKEIKHLGVYGLILKDSQILLIHKVGGPYHGKLDLPGGTIEYGETSEQALLRELKEEVGIEAVDYDLYDANSIAMEWEHKGEMEKIHHIGIFYKINDYKNSIQAAIKIDQQNDDSAGAAFYEITKISRKDLSNIAILELEKFGYLMKD